MWYSIRFWALEPRLAAAMTSGRNSMGVEIDEGFQHSIRSIARGIVKYSNRYLRERVLKHLEFVKNRVQTSGSLKYRNKHYGFPVVTSQEQSILLNGLKDFHDCGDNTFEVMYSTEPQYTDTTYM